MAYPPLLDTVHGIDLIGGNIELSRARRLYQIWRYDDHEFGFPARIFRRSKQGTDNR